MLAILRKQHLIAILCLLAASAPACFAQMAPNITQRVLMLRYAGRTATGFTLDLDARQYLITAAHVIAGMEDTGKIEIRRDEKWVEYSVKRLNVPEPADVAVLAPSVALTPSLELPTLEEASSGTDGFFLGFPYGISIPSGTTNNLYPLPFIKKAFVSGVIVTNGVQRVFLDGINNPGFSGGPVVILDPRDPYPDGSPKVKVIGIISGFRNERVPVRDGGNATNLTVETNTGIIEAVGIRHAINAIRLNPIGATP